MLVEARTWLRCHLENKTQKQIISHPKGDLTRNRRRSKEMRKSIQPQISIRFHDCISTYTSKATSSTHPPKIALKIPCLVQAHVCGALSLSLFFFLNPCLAHAKWPSQKREPDDGRWRWQWRWRKKLLHKLGLDIVFVKTLFCSLFLFPPKFPDKSQTLTAQKLLSTTRHSTVISIRHT
ncbi:hypothetical protein DER45DRAFT_336877 [Fusarium avenaceum]|nr:hypothetical protein DER45DRAFT_336877 [Fusarium avenaceum]